MLEHGGTDLGPAVRWDFSTNANALGPLPAVQDAVQRADRCAYPEPSYAALRAEVARHLGVAPDRVCPTAGNAEAIRRLSLALRLSGVQEVWLPRPGYGEYEAAAQALGLRTRAYADLAALIAAVQAWQGSPGTGPVPDLPLIWLCEPCNPTGDHADAATWQALQLALLPMLMPTARNAPTGQGGAARPRCHLAIDRAYEPLRLQGADPIPPALAQSAWQLWSPNKALSLTGVRAGVMVAPAGVAPALFNQVADLAPSWVLSSEGQALLRAWAQPATQSALQAQRHTLAAWLAEQAVMLHGLGWVVRPSAVPFHLARPPVADLGATLASLRTQGIKLRDATSLGLPGWVRLRAMPPEAQQALAQAWQAWRLHRHPRQDAA